MIRAAMISAKNGRKLIMLGLTDENIAKLIEGNPILIHAEELGFAGDISIMHGKTDDAIEKELAPWLHPETIRDDPEPALGATGKFPDGKIRDDDEGELIISLQAEGEILVIDFGKKVQWIGMDRKGVADFILAIAEKMKLKIQVA